MVECRYRVDLAGDSVAAVEVLVAGIRAAVHLAGACHQASAFH